MEINITEIIIALIGLCGTIVTAVFIPYIRSQMTDAQWNRMRELITVGVSAAEQLSIVGKISKEDRKEYVIDLIKGSGIVEKLRRLGVGIDIADIYDLVNDLIESEVYNLPNKMTNQEYKKIAEQKVEVLADTKIQTVVEETVGTKLDEIVEQKVQEIKQKDA